MPEIYFFVTGGKAFEQPDKKRELTSQEKQDIEVFGRVREQTQSRMVAEFNYTVESWAALCRQAIRAALHASRCSAGSAHECNCRLHEGNAR